jgi:uncharacterized protein (TIGR02996 family)
MEMPAMSASLRRALEDELAASPDDLATHAAYADLLGEMEDPRGELIVTQMALEDASLDGRERERLLLREAELLRDNTAAVFGKMAPFLKGSSDSFSTRRGWLDALDLGYLSLPLARALRDAPEARLLRVLTIASGHDVRTEPSPDDNAPEHDAHPGLWPLVGSPALANVRVFTLGEDEGDGPDFECSLSTSAAVPLVRSMPRLDELHLFAQTNALTDLFTLPTVKNLRVLKAYHNSQVHRLDVLAANPAFRNLTHLLLHPHALAWHDNGTEDERAGFREEEGYLPLRVVEALVRSPNLPHLTHLQLRLSSLGDAGCQMLVESGIMRRLKGLDLRHGCISDEGARVLIDGHDARQLSWLDLGHNSLSEEMAARVQALGVPCRVDGQHGEGEEDEYLHEGDIE